MSRSYYTHIAAEAALRWYSNYLDRCEPLTHASYIKVFDEVVYEFTYNKNKLTENND